MTQIEVPISPQPNWRSMGLCVLPLELEAGRKMWVLAFGTYKQLVNKSTHILIRQYIFIVDILLVTYIEICN